MKTLSKLMILEHPQADGIYYMGTDPIPFGDRAEAYLETEERSKQCSVIIRENPENEKAPYPVAFYLARTNDVDFVFNETFALQKAYNNCKNNLERNAGSTFMQRYDDSGLSRYLSPYPYSALLANWRNAKLAKEKKRLRGWNNDNSTKGPATKVLVEWMIYGMDYCWSYDIIEDIEKLGIENTDIAWALIAALIDWKHHYNLRESKYKEQKPIYKTVYVSEGGKAVAKKIKLRGISDHEGIDMDLRLIHNPKLDGFF